MSGHMINPFTKYKDPTPIRGLGCESPRHICGIPHGQHSNQARCSSLQDSTAGTKQLVHSTNSHWADTRNWQAHHNLSLPRPLVVKPSVSQLQQFGIPFHSVAGLAPSNVISKLIYLLSLATPFSHCNEVHLNYVKCIIVYTHITLALYRLD